ncbi:MAG: hypothetical protein ACREFO_11880 [Acetobacteraceae bacterium]
MADNFTPRVKAILRENDCTFVRQGKGDHEIWYSPISKLNFMVDSNIKSRHWANHTLGEPHTETSRATQGVLMATRKRGVLTAAASPADWWKHLRRWKRAFWKRERKAAKRAAGSPGQAAPPDTGPRAVPSAFHTGRLSSIAAHRAPKCSGTFWETTRVGRG